jgi:RNA polymerase sigma-70 factor, ECF subfamily
MKTPIVLETRRAGHLRFGSAPAYAPVARRRARRSTTTPERVLDPHTLGEQFDRLFRAAWAMCGSREDAEDLVQETFSRVLARPRILRHEDDLGYLLRVLRNTFISSLRTASRRPRTTPIPDDIELAAPHATADPARAYEARSVFEEISRLDETYRDVIVAIDVAGLSYSEAAKALRVREATIASRLFRARSKVAKSLSQPSRVSA